MASTHTLGERRAHDDSPHAAGGLEVSLAALSPAGGQVRVDLRHVAGELSVLRGYRSCRRCP